MSTLGNGQGSLHTLMMRSSTPASNEKVLLYLQGMDANPPDDEDGQSNVTTSEILRSSRAKSKAASSVRQLSQLGGEENPAEDIRSDVQEHASELGRTIPIHTTGIPDHEPGPDDPPGPKFESYGSSFGNFGPLPRESFNGRNGIVSPSKAAAVPLPETTIAPASPTESHPNPFSQFGMSPVQTAGIAGAAPYAGAPSGVGGRSRHAASTKASHKSPSVAENGVASPKATSRALSPNRTGTVAGATPERPWSPRTAASQNQSVKSRNTQKTQRTVYPPLPDSVLDDGQRTTKAYSIAPSESASQVGSRRLRQHQQLLEQQQREREEEQRERERELEKQRGLERDRQNARTPSQKPSKSVKSTTDVNGHGGSGGTTYAKSQSAARSQAPMSPRSQPQTVYREPSVAPTEGTRSAAPPMSPARSKHTNRDPDSTPTPSRPASPENPLSLEEQRLVQSILDIPRTRTSYALSTMAPSALEPEVQNTHFHDMELCQLLHALDQPMGEPVKKAVRKAVRARVKKLGMKYDNESIKAYRKSFHDHDPVVHLIPALTGASSKRSALNGATQDPPEWAKELLQGFINMQNRIDDLAPKIEKSLRSSRGGSYVTERGNYPNGHQHYESSEVNDGYTHSQHQTGDESMYQAGEGEMIRDSTHLHTLPGSMHHHDGSMHGAIREQDIYEDEEGHHFVETEVDTRGLDVEYGVQDRENSPGQQYLEQELYKLRLKPSAAHSVTTHKTWELARDDGAEYDEEEGDPQVAITESGLPEIPDGNTGVYTRGDSPPLPPIPAERGDMLPVDHGQVWQQNEYSGERQMLPPWQRIHQRLLSWAIVWPMSELDNAVNSCSRGMQVDEIALSIWSTQTYKRYVRAKMTDSPPGRVDRLFVPPNMADAISTAVYNGRHGDACGMLRDLWAPFGLEGIPRLLIVLAKHRNDDNHWVVHRFSLPDGSLTTYDTYPERCLPDGRPLGWWFAIRIAWPDAIYPSPDHLMQKMVRLHRPMQLPIENSVAAAGIWRNLLMGSRAERSLDLERLRDLISTEVKNLRQRKIMGKLSIGAPRPNWEDMI